MPNDSGVGPDGIERIRKAQETGLDATTGSAPAFSYSDAALQRLGGGRPAEVAPSHDGITISSDMLEIEELASVSTPNPFMSLFSGPKVMRALAVGGLLIGCAAGTAALGPTGFLLTFVAEALAFAGGILFNKASRDQLEEENRRLRAQASRDAMTGVNNRGSIDEILREQLLRVPFGRGSVSVILADVDHFKSINDTHGHQVGDEVLIEVARRLKSSMRGEDSVGRYGGEEFLMVLPGIPGAQASLIAHRIRMIIAERPFQTAAGELAVTMSLGVAATDYPHMVPPDALVRAADEALYRAKHEGRNRVVVAPTNR